MAAPIERRTVGRVARTAVLLGAIGGCGGELPVELEVEHSQSAIQGGWTVASDQLERTGIFNLANSGCTATVLVSSEQLDTTWALSAAHCFDSGISNETLRRGTTNVTPRNTGDVFPNPGYQASNWRQDQAIIVFPQAVPILDAEGNRIPEFRRAVYTGPIANIQGGYADVFGTGRNVNGPGDVCDFSPNPSGARDFSLRHVRNTFIGEGYGSLAMSAGGMIPANSRILRGDSGGPWLYTNGSPVQSLDTLIDDGVVIASYTNVWCGPWGSQTSYHAASTTGNLNQTFLEQHLGTDLLGRNDPSEGSLRCPDNVMSDRGLTGRRRSCRCSAATTQQGAVWGSDVYTDDSSLCRAAVHAGAIAVTGGTITYEIRAGQSSYAGSERYGTTTSSWGAWGGSFVFTHIVTHGVHAGVCRDANGGYPRWSAIHNTSLDGCLAACRDETGCEAAAYDASRSYCQIFGSFGANSGSPGGGHITQGSSSQPGFQCHLMRPGVWSVEPGICRNASGAYPRWSSFWNATSEQCVALCAAETDCQGAAHDRTRNYCQIFGTFGVNAATQATAIVDRGDLSQPAFQCHINPSFGSGWSTSAWDGTGP